jgi:hypothetical protein
MILSREMQNNKNTMTKINFCLCLKKSAIMAYGPINIGIKHIIAANINVNTPRASIIMISAGIMCL